MNQIIVDAFLMSRLNDLKQSLELCDASGKVLARVVPLLDESQFEPIEPSLSEEEIQRRRAEPDYSTAEVLAYLEKL